MKCPKCAYLGYVHADKCRNCGYEFALSEPDAIGDLRLMDREQVPEPLRDLDLLDAARGPEGPSYSAMLADVPARGKRGDSNGLAELPLFGSPVTDDVPLITKPSPPRPPLAVRRATPDVPRLRAEPRAPLLDWADPPTPTPAPSTLPRSELSAAELESAAPSPRRASRVSTPADLPAAPEVGEPAPLSARALATAVDVLLLLVIDVLVVYFTLKICRVSLAEFGLIPKAPLLTFLLLQNGGYFIAFTATGQTLGKMLAGVRVLADDEAQAPDVGRSALRAGVWLLLALPAGLGLLTTFLMRDGRGLHDRFAGTRVVRAGA